MVWPTVTMQVSLVIAADVDSESTKARKAREYGIPIVDEAWLDRAIRNGLIEDYPKTPHASPTTTHGRMSNRPTIEGLA